MLKRLAGRGAVGGFGWIVFLSLGWLLSVPLLAGPITNDALADRALQYVGQWGGQCKAFVQKVVNEVAASYLLGTGYRNAYLRAGIEVNWREAVRGDIIQLYKPGTPDGQYVLGYHTAIVLKNLGGGDFEVVDSNFRWDETVTVHRWNPFRQAGKYGLQVYVYRLGQKFNIGDLVRTIDSLNVRQNPGLGSPVIKTMSANTTGRILQGPEIRDGYTWWKIRYSDGTTGWSSDHRLVRISVASSQAALETLIDTAHIQIFDLQGRLRHNIAGLALGKDGKLAANLLPQLPNGVYVVVLTVPGPHGLTQKLVKLVLLR